MSGCYQVTVIAPSAAEAERLARSAVAKRLAACAQVSGPITSTYWWDGEITVETEWTCTLKTVVSKLQPLMAALKEEHTYEVPEIIAVPIGAGDAAYLAWIERETSLG